MSEYGLLNISSSKNLLSDYRSKNAYLLGSADKDNRDEINLDELNELLGLDSNGRTTNIETIMNQMKNDSKSKLEPIALDTFGQPA